MILFLKEASRDKEFMLQTSLVLRGKGLEVPGVLQSLHLVTDSSTEKTYKVQAVQLEL